MDRILTGSDINLIQGIHLNHPGGRKGSGRNPQFEEGAEIGGRKLKGLGACFKRIAGYSKICQGA